MLAIPNYERTFAPMLLNHRSPDDAAPFGRCARILLLDSKPLFQAFLRSSLQKAGYIVYLAGDSQEALELLKGGHIDLLLLDGSMSGLDAAVFCATARKVSSAAIVLVAALRRPEVLLNGVLSGADDIIIKPFQLREVEVRIQRLLQGGSNGD